MTDMWLPIRHWTARLVKCRAGQQVSRVRSDPGDDLSATAVLNQVLDRQLFGIDPINNHSLLNVDDVCIARSDAGAVRLLIMENPRVVPHKVVEEF